MDQQRAERVEADVEENDEISCREAVLSCFPDICPEYLDKVGPDHQWDSGLIITYVLDQQEASNPYPKRQASKKRKRENSTKSQVQNFDNPEKRHEHKDAAYISRYLRASKTLLVNCFPRAYATDVDLVLGENHSCVFQSYAELYQAFVKDAENSRFKPLKMARKCKSQETLEQALVDTRDAAAEAALMEFRSARDYYEAERVKRLEEQVNFETCRRDGMVKDCECCYDEFAMNRMVHCDGELLHWFCKACAKQQAQTQIGLSKYELKCMSMDQCTGGFSRDQRKEFLDDKMVMALERIEQEDALRTAGLDDLEMCPFCPYAEEYPPVELDREFRCMNPVCEVVSCRLCKKETHIPKSCQEAALDEGHSARRTIEEAMSQALIRKCNKCGTPFIKENGCNKMTCTRGSCQNVQCYVCSKSCDYDHFNDQNRGGKPGNCPLFDNVEARHEEEVRVAEETARKQVQADNPEVDAELFEIKVSDEVKQAEERRKANHAPRNAVGAEPAVLNDDVRVWDAIPQDRRERAVFDGLAQNRINRARGRAVYGEPVDGNLHLQVPEGMPLQLQGRLLKQRARMLQAELMNPHRVRPILQPLPPVPDALLGQIRPPVGLAGLIHNMRNGLGFQVAQNPAGFEPDRAYRPAENLAIPQHMERAREQVAEQQVRAAEQNLAAEQTRAAERAARYERQATVLEAAMEAAKARRLPAGGQRVVVDLTGPDPVVIPRQNGGNAAPLAAGPGWPRQRNHHHRQAPQLQLQEANPPIPARQVEEGIRPRRARDGKVLPPRARAV